MADGFLRLLGQTTRSFDCARIRPGLDISDDGIQPWPPASGMSVAPQLVIRADADPQTIPRLVNFFAQLGTVPRQVSASSNDGVVDVVIEPQGLTDFQIDVVAEKMRSLVLVEHVSITRGAISKSAGEGRS